MWWMQNLPRWAADGANDRFCRSTGPRLLTGRGQQLRRRRVRAAAQRPHGRRAERGPKTDYEPTQRPT